MAKDIYSKYYGMAVKDIAAQFKPRDVPILLAVAVTALYEIDATDATFEKTDIRPDGQLCLFFKQETDDRLTVYITDDNGLFAKAESHDVSLDDAPPEIREAVGKILDAIQKSIEDMERELDEQESKSPKPKFIGRFSAN